MKKVLKGLLAVLAFTTIFAAAEVKASDGIGLTVGVDYWSSYISKGMYSYGDQQGWFFPYASFELISGLSVGVCGELNSAWVGSKSEEPEYNGAQKDYNAFGGGLDYEYSAEGLFTASVGLWYYRTKNNFWSYGTAYAGFDLDMAPFVTPFVMVTAEHYTGDNTTEKGFKESYKEYSGNSNRTDIYLQAGLKKSVEIAKDVAGLDFGAVVGYLRLRSFGANINDISDIDFFVNSSVTYGLVTFTGGFHYVIVPSKELKYDAPVKEDSPYGGEKDIHRFYATFGASVSI